MKENGNNLWKKNNKWHFLFPMNIDILLLTTLFVIFGLDGLFFLRLI